MRALNICFGILQSLPADFSYRSQTRFRSGLARLPTLAFCTRVPRVRLFFLPLPTLYHAYLQTHTTNQSQTHTQAYPSSYAKMNAQTETACALTCARRADTEEASSATLSEADPVASKPANGNNNKVSHVLCLLLWVSFWWS